MKKKELIVKILAGLLVAGMLVGLLPMFASAAEVDYAGDSHVTTTLDGDQATKLPENDIESYGIYDIPSLECEVREKIEVMVARQFKFVRNWFNY